MKKILFAALCLITAFASCDDNTDTLGSSLTNTEDIIIVSDGVFDCKSQSILADSILSRSTMAYLGQLKDPETGAYIKSNFLAQFHCFEGFSMPERDSLINGYVADSCDVRFFLDSYIGDSLTSMKATLYELERPVEEGRDYYSSFDPEKEGYVRTDANALKVTKSYSLADMEYSDSLRASSSYMMNIHFRLNDSYTARDGRVYSNYGTYIMQQYAEHPEYFKNSYNFLHNVCPGFYVKSESGVGTMAAVLIPQLTISFKARDAGTIRNSITNFMGTEEVRQLTQILNNKEQLQQLVDDNSCTYIKSPAGILTQIEMPVEQIHQNHENDSINSAKIVLPCVVNSSESEYAFSAPEQLLMIEADSVASFFAKNKVPNYRNSFIASYDKSKNQYVFNNCGQIIQNMMRQLPDNAVLREQWKQQHPNWNKVILIPVTMTTTSYSQTTVPVSVRHDIAVGSVKLVGGSDNKNGAIQVSVIYSNFNK